MLNSVWPRNLFECSFFPPANSHTLWETVVALCLCFRLYDISWVLAGYLGHLIFCVMCSLFAWFSFKDSGTQSCSSLWRFLPAALAWILWHLTECTRTDGCFWLTQQERMVTIRARPSAGLGNAMCRDIGSVHRVAVCALVCPPSLTFGPPPTSSQPHPCLSSHPAGAFWFQFFRLFSSPITCSVFSVIKKYIYITGTFLYVRNCSKHFRCIDH